MTVERVFVALGLVFSLERTPASSQQPGSLVRDPRPEAAIPALLAAFDTFQIVAIGDYHGSSDVEDFVMALVRHPAFPRAVNDVVLEGINGMLQPLLDRYVAGDD